jgi:hypothetical protein
MPLTQSLSYSYNCIKNYATSYAQTSTFANGFVLGFGQAIAAVGFLQPIVKAHFAPMVTRARAYLYPDEPRAFDHFPKNIVQQTSTIHEVIAQPEHQNAQLLNMVFTESFQANLQYMTKIVVYYAAIAPLLNLILYYSLAERNESGEITSDHQQVYNIIDWFAFVYFIRNAVDLLVQNKIYAKLILSISKNESEYHQHSLVCKEALAECEHLHACGCVADKKAEGESDSTYYYLSNYNLVSLLAKAGSTLGFSTRLVGYVFNLLFAENSLLVSNIYKTAGLMGGAASVLEIAGMGTKILADGWSIGEFPLNVIETCTEHRYKKLNQNYPYYLGIGWAYFLMCQILSKPLSRISGASETLISLAVCDFLFQTFIAISLRQNKPLPGQEAGPDVFYYHRLITDKITQRVSNWLSPRIYDTAFRQRCKTYLNKPYLKMPLGILTYIFFSPNTKSLQLFAQSRAVGCLIGYFDQEIETILQYLAKANKLPAIAQSSIATAVTYIPSVFINSHIKLIVGIAQEYGIEKLIKLIEETVFLARRKQPAMLAEAAKIYNSFTREDEHFSPRPDVIVTYPNHRETGSEEKEEPSSTSITHDLSPGFFAPKLTEAPQESDKKSDSQTARLQFSVVENYFTQQKEGGASDDEGYEIVSVSPSLSQTQAKSLLASHSLLRNHNPLPSTVIDFPKTPNAQDMSNLRRRGGAKNLD